MLWSRTPRTGCDFRLTMEILTVAASDQFLFQIISDGGLDVRLAIIKVRQERMTHKLYVPT
jgi:hypothetical protein